jgi:stearoyl-CoA desaturase (delta-9 desaturase)
MAEMGHWILLRAPERTRIAVFLRLTWDAAVLGRHGWTGRQRLMHLAQALQSLAPCLLLIACVVSRPRWDWTLIGIAYGTCALSWTGIALYYHRCLAHEAFRVRSRALRKFFELVGVLSFQEHPVVWAHYHRRHHQASDTPDDPHSPHYFSLMWIFGFFRLYPGPLSEAEFGKFKKGFPREIRGDETRDEFERRLARYLVVLYGLHLALACGLAWLGGRDAVVAFQLVPALTISVALFAFIQYGSHRFGYKNFPSRGDDRSRNFLPAAVFASEWHQNHHEYPSSCREGLKWWEFDPAYRILQLFAALGWVSDLTKPR